MHATIPNGNMGYNQYTIPVDCSCRTYFCCFLLALANICPWPLVLFFQISLKNSELKTTHNSTYRDCRVHFLRQRFSKWLYLFLFLLTRLHKRHSFSHLEFLIVQQIILTTTQQNIQKLQLLQNFTTRILIGKRKYGYIFTTIRDHLDTTFRRTSTTRTSFFFFCAIASWSKLNEDSKNSMNVDLFKRHARRELCASIL